MKSFEGPDATSVTEVVGNKIEKSHVMPQGAFDAARVQAETQQIERGLEDAARDGGFRARFKVFALAGALAAGLSSGAEGVEFKTFPAAPLVEGSPEYNVVEKYLGLDVRAIEKNFAITVQVNRGEDGVYILDIAQQHHGPFTSDASVKTDVLRRSTTIENQKNIEGLLLQLKDKGAEAVFAEGLVDVHEAEEQKKYLEEMKGFISAVPETLDGVEPLLKLYQTYEGDLLIFTDKGFEIDTKHPALIMYQEYRAMYASQKLQKINAYVAQHPDELEQASEHMKIEYRDLSDYLKKDTGREADYYMGGDYKVYFDGQLKVLPAELKDLHDRGLAITKHKDHLSIEISRISERDPNDPQLLSLRTAMTEIEEQYNEIVVEGRENAVLENIDTYRLHVGAVPFVPVVFGYGHDFKNNVEELNAARAGDPQKNQYGLIRFSPHVVSTELIHKNSDEGGYVAVSHN